MATGIAAGGHKDKIGTDAGVVLKIWYSLLFWCRCSGERAVKQVSLVVAINTSWAGSDIIVLVLV